MARRGGTWTLLGEASQRVAQSLTFVALAALLKPSEFGAAATAFFILQIVFGLTYAGLGTAVQALGPNTLRDRTALGLAALSGLAAGGVIFALAEPVSLLMHSPHAVNLIRLIAIVPAAQQYTTVAVALLERDFRFGITGVAQTLSSIVSVVVGVSLAALGAGAISLIAAAVMQQIARFVVIAVADPSCLSLTIDWACALEIWEVGRHLMATSFVFAIFNNVDTLAVGAILGPKALGLYSFAYNAAMTTFFLANVAVSRVLLPIFARLQREDRPTSGIFSSTAVSVSWIATLPLALLATQGPELLHAFLGAQWDGAGWTLRVLCLAAYLRIAAPVCLSVIVVAKQSRLLWIAQIGQLALMAACLYPFTRFGGIVGCASGVTVSIFLANGFLLSRTLKIADLRLAKFLPRLVLAPATGVVAGLLAAQVRWLDGKPQAVEHMVIYLVLWVVSVLLANPSARRQAIRAIHQRTMRPAPVG